MGRNKSTAGTKKLIWRMSNAEPLGAIVHADSGFAPEVSLGGWAVSSFELLHGTEITENPDTIPDALLDELFAAHNGTAAPSGRK